MKKFFFSVLLLQAVSALPAAAQTPRWLDPSVAAEGKELPRGNVVSFNTREDALRRDYEKSRYLQPLTEWTREDRGESVAFTTRYKIPFEWVDRRQFLAVDRVSGSYDVVVNGRRIGYSQTGSTPAEFDLTAASREGNNDLEIVVYKKTAAAALENGRVPYTPGILGEVRVISQPGVRVRDVFADTRMNGTSGLMQLGVVMKSNLLNAKDYRVWYELISPNGEVVSEGYRDVELGMRREDTVAFFANIPHILPWSHEQPNLYTLYVNTRNEGRYREHLSFSIGFRSVDVRGGIIYLNDIPLRMNPRDFLPSTDPADNARRLERLAESGVDAVRIKGMPPDRDFYELCDRLGVYVINQADVNTSLGGENRGVGGNPSNDPAWEAAYLDRVMSMYHTSKNSPSVIAFSLAERSANGYNLYESYLSLKAVEKQRPVVYPDGGEWNDDRVDFAAMTGPAALHDEIVSITPEGDAARGGFSILNRRVFTPVIGEAAYTVLSGGRTVAQGSIPVDILPGRSAAIAVPVDGLRPGKKYEIRIEVATDAPVTRYVPAEEGAVDKRLRGTAPGKIEKEVVGKGVFTGRLPK